MRLIIKNKKGILLFEVVVALTILAAGLTFISHSFTSCIRALGNTRDYNLATMLADEVFWDLEIKEPDAWREEGGFEQYPRFNWTLESEDIESSKLKKIKLNINWKSRNRNYKLIIPTFM